MISPSSFYFTLLLNEVAEINRLKKCWMSIYASKSEDIRKMSKGIDNVTLEDFKKDDDQNLKDIHTQIATGKFEFDEIKSIPKKKSNGKIRLISAPTVRDRVVHKSILSILSDALYDHINTGVSYCGVKKDFWKKEKDGLSIKRAIEQLVTYVKRRNYWIFETDIKGFFDHVPKEKILKKVCEVLPDRSLEKYLKQIIFFDIGNESELLKKEIEIPNKINGLAQGSSLSPLFANLFLAEFDNYMKSKYGFRYIRYVDDFIVVCESEEEAKEAELDSTTELKKENLELSKDKTHILDLNRSSLKFLGVHVDKFCIKPKKTTGKIRDWLVSEVLNTKSYKVVLRAGKEVSVIEQINEKIQGWGNFYRYYHAQELFESLDEFILKRKKGDKNLKDILLLKEVKLETIVSQEEWQSYFKE
ncbi:hypothetical protein IPN35_01560 [Candidatus Peregrinibacteria bacterium]|nr:MAG: hypothetical protein IPN35_01560 [Candidatus Peregrinibacteria bacterium]